MRAATGETRIHIRSGIVVNQDTTVCFSVAFRLVALIIWFQIQRGFVPVSNRRKGTSHLSCGVLRHVTVIILVACIFETTTNGCGEESSSHLANSSKSRDCPLGRTSVYAPRNARYGGVVSIASKHSRAPTGITHGGTNYQG